MDKNPESYNDLASFLSRTIFSQIASPADVGHAMRGEAEPRGVESDHVPPTQNPLERPATECIAVSPPPACCPNPGVGPNIAAENKYLREFNADLATITTKANTHTCTFTCHKNGHAKSCRYATLLTVACDNGFVVRSLTRLTSQLLFFSVLTAQCHCTRTTMCPSLLVRFGFDNGGKPIVDRTSVQRGFRKIFPNGDSLVGDVLYPASDCAEAVAAASAAEEQEKEERLQFDHDAAEVVSGKRDFATVTERFTSKHRREQPMINSYNPIIQYCTRSNIDVRVLLRDSDARGALFYILNYATKTESTMDALLNILAPVVERIKDETNGATDKVIAAALVRSCSCKTVAHMSLGGPAAASKVLGHTDVLVRSY